MMSRLACVVILGMLTACVGNHPVGTGPFDSRGNYVEAWADDPSKWTQPPSDPDSKPPLVAQANPKPEVSSTPVVAAPKPKPKPKPPSTRYHTVRRGDTLWGLSKRYGTTVGKIQSANGISGTVIRIGQKLKIPR